MRREQRRHGDFIFVPKPIGSVADYRSIVYKTFALVQWVALHSRPRFVVKTDDDAYVHMGNLVAALRKVGLCVLPCEAVGALQSGIRSRVAVRQG